MYFFLGIFSLSHPSPSHYRFFIPQNKIGRLLEYYENPQYHDILQRAQQEASYRPAQILNRLAQLAQNGITLLAMVGLLLSLHWGITGILFVSAIPAVLVRLKYANILYQWQRKRTPMERQSWYFGWMLTVDRYAKEIRLFELGNVFSQRFRQIRQQVYEEYTAIAKGRFFANIATQTLAGVVLFAAYASIIYRTIQGFLTLGDLVLYHQAFKRGQDALKGLLSSLSGLYEDNLFLANLYEFLDLKPKLIAPLHPKSIPRSMRTGIVYKPNH